MFWALLYLQQSFSRCCKNIMVNEGFFAAKKDFLALFFDIVLLGSHQHSVNWAHSFLQPSWGGCQPSFLK